jgi:hypothetical protein
VARFLVLKDGALASLIKRLAAKLTDMEVLEFIDRRAKPAERLAFNSSRQASETALT